jgi:methyl-accepting chemotaxis protein
MPRRAITWLQSPLLWGLLAISLFWMTIQLHYSAESRGHTYGVLINIKSLLINMLDLETGQRGYVITGMQEFLEPYHHARMEVDHSIYSIQTLVRDNPVQQQFLYQATVLCKKRVRMCDEAVTVRSKDGFEAAKKLVSTTEGKRTMDSLRTVMSNMMAEEYKELQYRNTKFQSDFIVVKYSVIGISILFGVSAAVYFVFTIRDHLKENRSGGSNYA